MQHQSFPRNGTFYRLAPLDFRTSISHWPGSTLDTLSSEGLRGDAFLSIVEEAARELGIVGFDVKCWTNNWAKVMCIECNTAFRDLPAARAFVDDVFKKLEPLVTRKLQEHIRNLHHAVQFQGSIEGAGLQARLGAKRYGGIAPV